MEDESAIFPRAMLSGKSEISIGSTKVRYGSMNLLSKADVEDNLMGVVSKEIADELFEILRLAGKD